MNKTSLNGTSSATTNDVLLGKLGNLTLNVTGEGSYTFSIIVMAAKGEYQLLDVSMLVKAAGAGFSVQVDIKQGDRDSRLFVDDGKYESDPNTVENSNDDDDNTDEEIDQDEEEEEEYEPEPEPDLSYPEYPMPELDDGCPVIPESYSAEYDFCEVHYGLRDAIFFFADANNDGYATLDEMTIYTDKLDHDWDS